MEIIGDKEFIRNTKKALRLIKETDKEKFEFVVSRICKIKKITFLFYILILILLIMLAII